ncbi:Gti1/Pac2 family-domain-containing protein [Phanerochaete sordida]|uniref:Gti1/Pac2 family-domain-containing protein n=1 Tax=Phanerochaete sordida TaxID=48140 RepID=A0A9P3LCF3_9APHY|nr:Gti1/Pac2 family-domain-containing protein [Phanerochaete sordida]
MSARPASSMPIHGHPFITHPALHLRDARDAHIVFEAVRLNILPLITRRLTTVEREQLVSGNVFVWEEAEHKQGGLERWTDGRRWSQSRMRGDYLFYEEKIDITPEERDAKAARRARKTLDPFSYQPAPVRRQDRPSKPDGLTKQTYSIQVHSSSYETPKKWHIVAYFSGDDYTRLPVVDNYEYLRNIRIPDGVYFAKGNLSKGGRMVLNLGEDQGQDEDGYDDQPGWISPSWPQTPTEVPHDGTGPSRHSSLSSASSGSPYAQQAARPPSRPDHTDARYSLPRLSTVAPPHHLTGQPRPACTPGSPYSPLTPEDRKALNSFRVVL